MTELYIYTYIYTHITRGSCSLYHRCHYMYIYIYHIIMIMYTLYIYYQWNVISFQIIFFTLAAH